MKIDMEFIRGICSDAANRRVVESMIAVARNFEMDTVAEGVEDRETFELPGDLGVDLVQGYCVPRLLDLDTVRSNEDREKERREEQRDLDREQSLLDLDQVFADRDQRSLDERRHEHDRRRRELDEQADTDEWGAEEAAREHRREGD